MTQTQLQIGGVEDATTQTGKAYCKVHTNMGTLSSWNTNVNQALKQKLGQMVTVDVKQNGNFSSIVGLVGMPAQNPQFGAPKTFSIGNQGVNQKKQSSFELSYAKDMWIALASGYDEADQVKKDEQLRYFAELSAELILRMRKIIDEANDGIIQEEKVN